MDKNYTMGSLYFSLDQLYRKGLVEKLSGEPTAERGGRKKIYYIITKKGEKALQAVLELHMKAWESYEFEEINIRVKLPSSCFALWLTSLINSACLEIFRKFLTNYIENKGILTAKIWYWKQIIFSLPQFIRNKIYWGGNNAA